MGKTVKMSIVLLAILLLAGCGNDGVLKKQEGERQDQAVTQQGDQENAAGDDNEDFNVYRDEKYGFEFQYPSDWEIEEDMIVPGIRRYCRKDKFIGDGKLQCSDGIRFGFEENEQRLSLAKLWESHGWEGGLDYRDLKNIKIDGTSAYTFTHTSRTDGSEGKNLWVQLPDGKFFTLQGTELDEQGNAIFDEMVSSFKFSGQESLLDRKALEEAVYAAVDAKVKGNWDKKIEIGTVHETQKAVKGSWLASDKWGWIAWQKDDGKWNILVSTDGFSCKEVDMIPVAHKDFFHDDVYSKSMDGKESKNCF